MRNLRTATIASTTAALLVGVSSFLTAVPASAVVVHRHVIGIASNSAPQTIVSTVLNPDDPTKYDVVIASGSHFDGDLTGDTTYTMNLLYDPVTLGVLRNHRRDVHRHDRRSG